MMHTYQSFAFPFSVTEFVWQNRLSFASYILFMVQKTLLMSCSSFQFINCISAGSKRELLFQRPTFYDAKIS